jgi:hypothetical protein
MKTFKEFVAEAVDTKSYFMNHARKMQERFHKADNAKSEGAMENHSMAADRHWQAITDKHGSDAADSVAYGTPNTDEHREEMFKKHCK